MQNSKKIELPAVPNYFVSVTDWCTTKPDPALWVKTKAKTLEGAKRLAAKLPRGITATVRVAIANALGEFDTVATLSDSSAITRRRPTWCTHRRTTGQASA